jgi:hypothetical protein
VTGRRADTLSGHAAAMALASDQIITAVQAEHPDLDLIEQAIEQALSLRPPHPFSSAYSLAVVLAAQVDTSKRLGERLGWVAAREPGLEIVA